MSDFEKIFMLASDLNSKIQHLGLTRKEVNAILDLIYREEK